MTILVIAEHENGAVAPATLNTVAAAAKIGGDIHVLVAGANVGGVAEAAAKIAGVAKVLVADNAAYAHVLPENVAPLGKEPATTAPRLLPFTLTTWMIGLFCPVASSAAR